MIPDSNHGFKMTGLGKLVAKLLSGQNWVAELEPSPSRALPRGGPLRPATAIARGCEGSTAGTRSWARAANPRLHHRKPTD